MSKKELNNLLNELILLPDTEYEKVKECSEKLAEIVDEYGAVGVIALALVSSQLDAKETA